MGGYFVYDNETLGAGTVIQRTFGNSNSMYPEIPANLVQPSGYTDGKSSARTVRNEYSRAYVNATGTWFTNAKGQHAIKGGVRFGRSATTSTAAPSLITLNWNTHPMNETGESGPASTAATACRESSRPAISCQQLVLFIQDWSPSSKLTINAGVRSNRRCRSTRMAPRGPGLDFGLNSRARVRLRPRATSEGLRTWDVIDIASSVPRSFGGQKWWLRLVARHPTGQHHCQEGGDANNSAVEPRFGSNEIDPSIDAVHKKFRRAATGSTLESSGEAELSSASTTRPRAVGQGAVHRSWARGYRTTVEPARIGGYHIGNPGDGEWGDQAFL
jgi:hypothetical protein